MVVRRATPGKVGSAGKPSLRVLAEDEEEEEEEGGSGGISPSELLADPALGVLRGTAVGSTAVGVTAEEQAFLIEQRRLGGQVEELERVLRAKEEQMRRVGQAQHIKQLYDQKLQVGRSPPASFFPFEKTLVERRTRLRPPQELESERSQLDAERSRLLQALQALERSSGERQRSQESEYRSRISELEERLKGLQRKARQIGELERFKSRAEQACSRLESEILHIKQQKVALQKQMDQASRQFLELKRAQEKELLQLRREGQRDRLQVERLKALQDKQQAVLKRKTEEAEAARRRLKELMGRQQAAGSRPGTAAAGGRPGTAAPSDGLDIQPNQFAPLLRDDRQRRDWIDRELQLCLQWQDMQQVLEGELAERAELGRRVQELRRRLANLDRRAQTSGLSPQLQQQREDLAQARRTRIPLRAAVEPCPMGPFCPATRSCGAFFSMHRWSG